MSEVAYTLEYNGKVIANIPSASYETPWFSGKAEPVDKEVYDQLTKLNEFEIWSEASLSDDVSDEEYDAAMKERGIDPKYYDMKHSSGWVVRGSDGSVSAAIGYIDDQGVSWRAGEKQQAAKESKGIFGFFRRNSK